MRVMIEHFIKHLLTENESAFKTLFYEEAFLYDLSKNIPFEGVDKIYKELIRTFNFLQKNGMHYRFEKWTKNQDFTIVIVIFKDLESVGRVSLTFWISIFNQLIDHIWWKKN